MHNITLARRIALAVFAAVAGLSPTISHATGCENAVYRLYREIGLQLRNKTPKRRVKSKLTDDRRAPTRSSETWAVDFVHAKLATGRKLRVLTIVDTF